jgi:hypothetical protein
MSLALNGTNGVTYNDGTLQSSAPVGRNRIINGNMAIDQRNAGTSLTVTAVYPPAYSMDRFYVYGSVTSKFTAQQNAGSVTPPTGFTNYLGCTSLSAYSVGSSDNFLFGQYIEGFNVADLDFGKATAKTVTLSFWVRSSLTGTFGGSLVNSANNRSYVFSYTISSANTWEQKSITITGDITGTWLTNNGVGLALNFSIGSGSTFSTTAGSWVTGNFLNVTGATSVVGTSGATFYITGVQLETGTTATDFENLQYGTQLSLCQRYYQKISGSINGGAYQQFAIITYESATTAWGVIPLKVTMRSQPTTTYSGSFTVNYGTQGTLINDTNQTGGDLATIGWTTGSGGTVPSAAYIRANNSTATFISFSSEL